MKEIANDKATGEIRVREYCGECGRFVRRGVGCFNALRCSEGRANFDRDLAAEFRAEVLALTAEERAAFEKKTKSEGLRVVWTFHRGHQWVTKGSLDGIFG